MFAGQGLGLGARECERTVASGLRAGIDQPREIAISWLALQRFDVITVVRLGGPRIRPVPEFAPTGSAGFLLDRYGLSPDGIATPLRDDPDPD